MVRGNFKVNRDDVGSIPEVKNDFQKLQKIKRGERRSKKLIKKQVWNGLKKFVDSIKYSLQETLHYIYLNIHWL